MSPSQTPDIPNTLAFSTVPLVSMQSVENKRAYILHSRVDKGTLLPIESECFMPVGSGRACIDRTGFGQFDVRLGLESQYRTIEGIPILLNIFIYWSVGMYLNMFSLLFGEFVSTCIGWVGRYGRTISFPVSALLMNDCPASLQDSINGSAFLFRLTDTADTQTETRVHTQKLSHFPLH